MHPRAIVPGCLVLAAAVLVPLDAARAAGPAALEAGASGQASSSSGGSGESSGEASTEPLEPKTTGSVDLIELDAEGNPIEPEDPEVLAAKQRPWIRRWTPRRNMWEVGFFGGLWLPSDVIELHDRNLPPIGYDTSAELGLRVGYYPLQHFGLEGELAMIPSRLETEQRAFVSTARAHAVLQLGLWRLVPFAVLGGGVLSVRSEPNAAGNNGDESLHVGGGLKFFVNEHIVLRLEGRDVMSPKEGITPAAPAHSGEVLFGFTLALGPRKPKEAPPPPDSDGDGFLDEQDQCPEQAGIAPDGCPAKDTDGDGFLDPDDACVDQPGVAPDGCPIPDGDGDGFLDPDDACPTEAGVAPDGCPDPDPDRDGILGEQDRCPDDPETFNGFEDADGCPDELPEEVEKYTGVIEGIYFDTGKATIRSKSYATLDAAVKVLADYPSLRVEVSGHTDDKGKREKNLKLSQGRADSVKQYLVGKGIAEDRITTRGAGPDEPIGDNATKDGRQQNRRIEFKLLTEPPTGAAGADGAPPPASTPGADVCTMEVKTCPDGTEVGRQPPTCEFAPCPGEGEGGAKPKAGARIGKVEKKAKAEAGAEAGPAEPKTKAGAVTEPAEPKTKAGAETEPAEPKAETEPAEAQ